MNAIELIGFVISMLALVVLSTKKAIDEKRRRDNPEEFERQEREQAERLKAFLHSINEDMDVSGIPELQEEPPRKPIQKQIYKKPAKPAPQKQVQPRENPYIKTAAGSNNIESRQLNVNLDKHTLKSSLSDHYKVPSGPSNSKRIHLNRESDAYAIKTEVLQSRGTKALSRLNSTADMVIYQEIISAPLALRSQPLIRR